jgi:hypothetical protein
MKIIKLSLLVFTIIAIFFAANNLIYKGASLGGGIDDRKPPPPPEKYIRNKIDSLKNLPALIFERKLYKLILFEINRDITNSEKNEELQQIAYTAYTNNFIKKSKNVFGYQTWENTDLNFIRTEVEKLMVSGFLDTTSQMNKHLTNIKKCIKDYDKIKKFTSLRGFTNTHNRDNQYLLSYKFPFESLKSKISKINYFKMLINDSKYLKNNKNLISGLDRIQRRGIIIYEEYVESKIAAHQESYREMSPENDVDLYRAEIYIPLKSVIDNFKNNCIDNDYNYNEERIANILNNLYAMDSEARNNYFTSN